MLDLPAPLHIHPLLVAIPVALLPAALNWWWTRSFPVTGDEAALPERHLALAQRVSIVTTIGAMTIGMIAGWSALWVIPLELAALACTTHRTRQRLFGETWPLHRYLLWRLRMFGGVWAFWVLLALAPAIIANVPSDYRWWAAGVGFVIALAWQRWYMRMLLVVLGATRLTRSDLDGPFQEVFRRARVSPPEVWRAGDAGGRLMNALALPALIGNGVLFFDTLLERLSPEEITAILAHEVAHLEHYTPRLMRMYAGGILFIFVLIMGGAKASEISPDLPSWLPVLSIAFVFGSFSLRARRMQPKETEADLRAVELCENPDALVSALTQTYTINHLPRRWSAHAEERATHPSLARRIADIRRHTHAPQPPPAAERIEIASTESGRWAVIDRDRVGFLWNVSDDVEPRRDIVDRAQRVERLALSDLSELRIAAGRGSGLMLTAVDHHARRWSMPLHEHDVARVQAALDRIDHLIVALKPAHVQIGPRLVAATGLLLAGLFGAFGAVAAPALLVLRRPARRSMIALSIALVGTAIAIAANADDSYSEMLVLAMLSAFALWDARARRQEEPTPQGSAWPWVERVAFAVPIAIGSALIVIDTRDLYDLHVAIRERAWFPAAAMALGAFFWWSPVARERRVAAIAASVAAAAIVVSSPWFLLGVVRDDLVASMPVLTDRFVPLTAVSHQTVDGLFDSIALASDGDTFLLGADPDDDAESESDPLSPRRYVVGAPSGWSRSFEAPQAALVDAHRLLVLERTATGSKLRLEDARSGRETWTLPIDSRDVWQIQAAPDGRWRASRRHGRQMTRIEGRVDSTDTRETVWTIDQGPPRGGPYVQGYADSRFGEGPLALGLVTTWQRPLLPWPYGQWRSTIRLVRAGIGTQSDIGRSRVNVDCPASPIGVDSIVCASFDGRWSRFWRFDPSTGQLSAAGQRHGALWGVRQLTPTLLSARDGVSAVLVALDSRTSTMLMHPWGECGVDDFSVAAGTIAMVCAGPSNTHVTLYRMGQ